MIDINYPFSVRTLSEDEGGGYLIEFSDLPGCVADGNSIEEALIHAKDAVDEWIDACKKSGREIPAPSTIESDYSGKILQRLPKYIHAKLANRAKLENVSINSLVQTFIAEGLGRREVLDITNRPVPSTLFRRFSDDEAIKGSFQSFPQPIKRTSFNLSEDDFQKYTSAAHFSCAFANDLEQKNYQSETAKELFERTISNLQEIVSFSVKKAVSEVKDEEKIIKRK